MVLVRTDILYNSVFWNWNLENRYTVKHVNLFFNFHLQSLGTLMCDFSLCYWSINRKLGCCACLPNLYTLNSSTKCTPYQISAYLKTKVLKETKKRKLPDFVEAGDDVAEVNPGRPRFCHLVKQVVPEKLQQVPVACFWPRWVLLESDWHNTRLCSCNRNKSHTMMQCSTSGTYSGRSFMVPSLASRRKSRPFCTSCRKNKTKQGGQFYLSAPEIFIFLSVERSNVESNTRGEKYSATSGDSRQ